MAEYTYNCTECHCTETIELGYNLDVPKTIVCKCDGTMNREYKIIPFHLKGDGWGKETHKDE